MNPRRRRIRKAARRGRLGGRYPGATAEWVDLATGRVVQRLAARVAWIGAFAVWFVRGNGAEAPVPYEPTAGFEDEGYLVRLTPQSFAACWAVVQRQAARGRSERRWRERL